MEIKLLFTDDELSIETDADVTNNELISLLSAAIGILADDVPETTAN